MRRRLAATCLLLLGACAHVTPGPAQLAVHPFSLTSPGEGEPPGWESWILSRFLGRTRYAIVDHEGERVLAATANASATGLLAPLAIPSQDYPILSWRWKVPVLIPGADVGGGADDSPVRVIVAFDGDKSKWDFEDHAFARTVKIFSGREMPYATIQYIWENAKPVESVIDNARTGRSKMLVVESGPARLGQWLYYKRDVRADYRRLFGEEPGKIVFVGVMTDSNATGATAVAFYGDIRFGPPD